MAIEVAKVELKTVQDASGLEACIRKGQFTADQVIAVIGKTEGNGGVNDFTRILADQAFRRVLLKNGRRCERKSRRFPMVWSGGCDGVITPHATIFARNDKTGPASKSRLAIGTAMSVELLPEDIGRPAMVEKVADAVKAAMRDAGIERSEGRALRADQDAAADHRLGARRREARPACRLRGARLHGRVERHDRARHRGGARRNRDAEGGRDLPQPRSLFVRRVLLVRRRTDAGADRAARQQAGRRRPLPHRPRGDEGRARHRRHLRCHPQCRA